MGELGGPTRESERIAGLDVARGLALLGIFLVNIQMMAQPIGEAFAMVPYGEGPAGAGLFYLVSIFFAGKSYPLFSMLFGIGLVLMYERARVAGRAFASLYLRRIAALLLIGIVHAFVLWYGDILIVYAAVAFIAMWFARLSGRVLLIVGAGFVLLAMLQGLAFGLLGVVAMAGEPPAEAAEVIDSGRGAVATLLEAWRVGEGHEPTSPYWIEAEREAFAHGPFADATLMRLVNWGSMIVFWMLLMGGGAHVVGLFLVGGGLFRMGLLTPRGRVWRRRLILLGLVVGVPGSALVSLAPALLGEESPPMLVLSMPGLMLFGPMVSLLYLGLAFEVASRLPALAAPFAAAGRMALTNYILQSLIAATAFHHWGLALFGETTRVGRVGLVAGVFVAQLVLSVLWLRAFRMGPLEWAWRAATYLRVPPLRRVPADPGWVDPGPL